LTVSDLVPYTEVIRALRLRHRGVVALLAEAMRKIEHSRMKGNAFQSWADSFLLSRISTEMLTSHYMAVVDSHGPHFSRSVGLSWEGPLELTGPDCIGIVDTKCNPGEICEEAAEAVKKMLAASDRAAGDELEINVHTHSSSAIEFSYIPRYLFFIVQELISNSAQATVEAMRTGRSGSMQPINVTVCADEKQVAIRISDRAGGVPDGKADEIWSYLFSTSEQPFQDYVESGSPLAGRGVGLPLGRLYARYLGGSLEIMTVPGTGVDAYLFLRRITPLTESFPGLQTSISDSVAPI